MTWTPASRSTVTGTCSPASVNTRVIPTFCAITPVRMAALPLQLDLDVDAGREVELHQGIDRLRGGIDDVEQPLVRPHLELLAALLVDVRRTIDREPLDPGRQRDRPTHLGPGPLGRVDDLARGCIQHAMIEGLEPDSYVLALHGAPAFTPKRRKRPTGR